MSEEAVTAPAPQRARIEFLREALGHLESRIQFVDNKASLFAAILGGFLLALGLVPLPHLVPAEGWTRWVWLALGVLGIGLALVTIAELLWTLRPTRRFFDRRVRLARPSPQDEPPPFRLLWPTYPSSDRWLTRDPSIAELHTQTVESLDAERMEDEYRAAHLVALQLARLKYHHYGRASWLMRLLLVYVVVAAVVIVTLAFV